MNISKFFILESNRISLFLLPLLQHSIVTAPCILHLPILVLVDNKPLCLALLDQLILRFLVCHLQYIWIVFFYFLQWFGDGARGLVADSLFVDLCVESQEGFGLPNRCLYIVVLEVVLAAWENRVDWATRFIELFRYGWANRTSQRNWRIMIFSCCGSITDSGELILRSIFETV